MLRGKDIKKYSIEYKNLYILNIHNGNRTNNESPVDIDRYPAIKIHLDKYHTEIFKRYDKGITPYNLRNCIYMDDFYKQKIIYSEIVQEPQFYLDYYHYFPEATTFIMTGENLEIVLACLNSKPYSYAFKKYYSGGGLGEYGYRYKKAFLEKLPLPVISDIALKNKIIELVTLINNSKDNNLIKDIQLKIDNLLYDYIGITKEEKRVINSN
ncbi:MAG: TaqI-like C-terminal specificity domain-containing protein [Clostridia bacterium]|nr:TaqI-like C-terminal specificity domain-containing protein [Clostridia bacterium]